MRPNRPRPPVSRAPQTPARGTPSGTVLACGLVCLLVGCQGGSVPGDRRDASEGGTELGERSPDVGVAREAPPGELSSSPPEEQPTDVPPLWNPEFGVAETQERTATLPAGTLERLASGIGDALLEKESAIREAHDEIVWLGGTNLVRLGQLKKLIESLEAEAEILRQKLRLVLTRLASLGRDTSGYAEILERGSTP
jgi:hypothetical protein